MINPLLTLSSEIDKKNKKNKPMSLEFVFILELIFRDIHGEWYAAIQ